MPEAGLAASTSDEPVLPAVPPHEETGAEAPAVVSQAVLHVAAEPPVSHAPEPTSHEAPAVISQAVHHVAAEPPVSHVPEPTSLNSCASVSDPEELAEQLLQGKLIDPHSVLSLWELLPHEAPHKAASGSSFFTGLYRRGGVLGLRANVARFPKVAQVLCAFVRQRRPSAVFTSLAIFCDIPTEPHRDSHNGPSPNLVFKLSDFSGGGVWCEGPGHDVRPVQGSPVQGRVLKFDDGCLELPAKDHWHMTEPWQGRRVVLVAYALPYMPSVKLEVPQALLELGFPLPPDFLPALADVPPLSNPAPEPTQEPELSSRPAFIIEVFSGMSRLSACLKQLGFDAIAVDHKRVPGAACHVHLVDLCATEGVELVRRWLAMPNCVGIWFAPPCGTASRAREIKGVPGPPPLRSEKFPNGLPQLKGQSLLRVTLANQLYECVSDLVLEAASRNLVIGVENPRQSLYWRTSMFARIAHLLQFTAFQSCAYGSRRPKWTAIAYTRGAFDCICKSCPGQSCAQRHLPWGVAPEAPNGFSTSLEAAYPLPLARALAHAFFQACPPKPPSPAGLQLSLVRGQVGSQPKASVTGPRVPEHARILRVRVPPSVSCPVSLRARLKDPWPLPHVAVCPERSVPADAQLLQIVPVKQGSSSAGSGNKVCGADAELWNELVWGIPFSPEQFVREAVKAGHPRTLEVSLPQVLKDAVCTHASLSESELCGLRARQFAKWLKLAQDLRSEEEALKASMHKQVATILKPKRLLLWKAMMVEASYDDVSIFDEVISGTNLGGPVPDTGVFAPKFKPASVTVDQLKRDAPTSRAALLSTIKSQGEALDREVQTKTLEERDRGWLSGPIEVDQLPPDAIVSRRFGIEQDGKIRLIDDFSGSGVNSSVETSETVRPQTVDVIAGLCLSLMRAQPGCSLKGRFYDLVSAYRQLALDPAGAWASYIGLWDPDLKRVVVFQLHALPFGAVKSVSTFLRTVNSVWHLGAFFFALCWSHYFDDFVSVARGSQVANVHQTITLLFALLGWDLAQGGKKDVPFAETFCALGVDIVLSSAHLGRVTICNTEKRVQLLVETMKQAQKDRRMSAPQALKLRGKLQFASGQLFGRQSKFCMQQLSDYAHGGAPPDLPTECIDTFTSLVDMLDSGRPRLVQVNKQQTWYVFTDASYSKDDPVLPCGVGGLLFDDKGVLVAGFSHALDSDVRKLLGEINKDTIIMEAEFVAVLLAFRLWGKRVANSPVVAFIDNNSVRDILISCRGRSPTVKSLLKMFVSLEVECEFIPWFSRVPSPSNCADLPSKPPAQVVFVCSS